MGRLCKTCSQAAETTVLIGGLIPSSEQESWMFSFKSRGGKVSISYFSSFPSKKKKKITNLPSMISSQYWHQIPSLEKINRIFKHPQMLFWDAIFIRTAFGFKTNCTLGKGNIVLLPVGSGSQILRQLLYENRIVLYHLIVKPKKY